MNNHLTDRQFWLNYWENKKDLIKVIPQKNYLKPLFDKVITGNKSIKNCIEIGGFPGDLSIYLKKYYHIEPTLFDYIIHPKIVAELLECNQLSTKDLHLIEADLFNYQAEEKFDLCLSYGFIEHFSDTQDLLKKHIDFIKMGGTLLIIVPNFLGLNGWVNKHFDYAVYEKHFLGCMNKIQLKKNALALNLHEIEAFYYGKFSIWVSEYQSRSTLFKIAFQIVRILGKGISKIIPVESKWFSPYTVLIAKKP